MNTQQSTEWDDLINNIKTDRPLQTARLKEAAAKLSQSLSDLDELKERIDKEKGQLLAELPEDIGEYEIAYSNSHSLVIKIPEKYEWDKKVLEDLFPAGSKRPTCVAVNFTINKRQFDASDSDVQSQLSDALTIKMGVPNFKVKTHGD